MLTICTWWWGDKYGVEHVRRLARGLQRNVRQPYRFLCVTDRAAPAHGSQPYEYWIGLLPSGPTCHISTPELIPIPAEDRYLLGVPGCFARLRMFDPEWNRWLGRVACIDLDCVVTGPLDPVFDRWHEPFVILQGANATNPCPYNGSLWMLRPGYRPDVWHDFSLDRELTWRSDGSTLDRRGCYMKFPDDQGWLAHKLPGAPGWRAGANGVYAFQKPGWPGGKTSEALPADARIVFFPGSNDPSKLSHLDWVRRHWLSA